MPRHMPVTMEENIGNHGYIGTLILRIYQIYRSYINGYFDKTGVEVLHLGVIEEA